MDHQLYAITALELKPRPVLPSEAEIQMLPIIAPFFPAGGILNNVSPTNCRVAVAEETLLLHFTCGEGAQSGLDMARTDCVEVALQGQNMGRWDFVVLSVMRDGSMAGFLETGMTYLGGGEAYGHGQKNDQGTRTPLEPGTWKASCVLEDGAWNCTIMVQMSLFGAKSDQPFSLQLYRKKHQTSEVLCPVPQDLNVNYSDRFEYDPLTFITVCPGTEDCIHRAAGVYDPDTGRWIRPGFLTRPTPAQEARLAQWRAESDVGCLVELAQWWQDVLMLDGVDFFFNQAGAYPWTFQEPWVERTQFNRLMAEGNRTEAKDRLRQYLEHLEHITAWWYADHTLGNQSPNWTNLGTLEAVQLEAGVVRLRFADGIWGTLATAAGGLRLSLMGRGYFDTPVTPLRPVEGETLTLEACGHQLKIASGPDWAVCWDGCKVLEPDSLKLWYENGRFTAVSLGLALPPKGAVSGFGERFDGYNQRGKRLFLYQRDSCEGCLAGIGNQAYKNIPLVTAEHGFTAFANHHAKIFADVGCSRAGVLKMVIDDPFLDIFYWGDSPAQAMGHYAALTGMPLLPPRWAFEPWCGGGAGRWLRGPLGDLYREQYAALERFRQEDIPHAGFYAEGAGAGWFGPAKKEELYKIVAAAQRQGIRVFSWQFPNISVDMAKELLPECPESDLPITQVPQGLPCYIDFTHPNAPALLRAQWRDRLDAGIRGSMVDFGDVVPQEAKFYDGRTGKTMHNGYAITYARAYREMFLERYGEDHVLFTRGAGAGSQAYACQFGGDHRTSFLGMRFAMSGGITAAVSGLPFWGGDAGGYDGFPDEETYLRWTAFACFNPLMRYHGTGPREPWEYSHFAVEVYRRYAWLRENLLPYIWHLAVEAHETGIPLLRPMAAAPGEQMEDWIYNTEYFFGSELLVAPVCDEGTSRDVWLPPGRWYSLNQGGAGLPGGHTYKITVPIDEIPVYLREGALMPLRLNENLKLGRSMTTSACQVLLLTPLVGQRQGSIHLLDGGQLDYHLIGGAETYVLCLNGPWSGGYLLLRGIDAPQTVALAGRTLQQTANRGGLLLDEGWCVLKNGDIAVRLWPGVSLTLEITYRRPDAPL